MLKEVTRLIYLDSNPPMPHRQPLTPTWHVVTEVSHIMFFLYGHIYFQMTSLWIYFPDNTNQTMFDTE